MEPLFLAAIYGCNAGLYRETLHEVYIPRIQRERPHSLLPSSEPEEHCFRFWSISLKTCVGIHPWKQVKKSKASPLMITSSSWQRRR